MFEAWAALLQPKHKKMTIWLTPSFKMASNLAKLLHYPKRTSAHATKLIIYWSLKTAIFAITQGFRDQNFTGHNFLKEQMRQVNHNSNSNQSWLGRGSFSPILQLVFAAYLLVYFFRNWQFLGMERKNSLKLLLTWTGRLHITHFRMLLNSLLQLNFNYEFF